MSSYLRVSLMRSRRRLQLKRQLRRSEAHFKSVAVDLKKTVVAMDYTTNRGTQSITTNNSQSHSEDIQCKTQSKTWTTMTTMLLITTKTTTISCLLTKQQHSSLNKEQQMPKLSTSLTRFTPQWYRWWEKSPNCSSNKFSKTISPCNTVIIQTT